VPGIGHLACLIATILICEHNYNLHMLYDALLDIVGGNGDPLYFLIGSLHFYNSTIHTSQLLLIEARMCEARKPHVWRRLDVFWPPLYMSYKLQGKR